MNEEAGSGAERDAPPTLERIDGRVPAATTSRGRYVRFFAGVVVVLFAIALAWGAVALVSSIHRG